MIFLANIAWFLSSLPDYLLFGIMLHFPEFEQRRAEHRASKTGRIISLEPTSGSAGPTKWIPRTSGLQREFLRAVNPWMCRLYLTHPVLFFRTHYWSISPSAKPENPPEVMDNVGFADDREYLSGLQGFVSSILFAVPSAVGRIEDHEKHAMLTMLYMLSSRSLGLISVWHPSFLTILLDFATANAREIEHMLDSGLWPDGKKHLRCPDTSLVCNSLLNRDYASVWPKLCLISCWDQARAAGGADTLRKMFPGVTVEGKGLLATEGAVTIPWDAGKKVAAVRSHRFHFAEFDVETGRESSVLSTLSNVKNGQSYTVHLTTGNGSVKYPLGDVVICSGFIAKTPCFDFLYRAGGVSDLHGEKLHSSVVEGLLKELETACGRFQFAMLFPRADVSRYVLLCETELSLPDNDLLDNMLSRNYYYRHAVQIGQLAQAQVFRVTYGMARFRRHKKGCIGSVKPPPLYVPRDEDEWRLLDQEFFV